jgi:DNA-directed RNA polymerase subunit RPC12/RpoP
VSYGDPDIDNGSEEVANDGGFTVTAVVTLPCAECGTELKQTEAEYSGETTCPGCEANLAATATKSEDPETEDQLEHDFEITDTEVDIELDYKTLVGKNGKKLKTTIPVYKVNFTVKFKCNLCGSEWQETETIELTTGDFEEV